MVKNFELWIKELFGKPITRNGPAVSANTKQVSLGDGGSQLLATKETYILLPKRYEDIDLAINEDVFQTIGYYCTVSGDHYGVVKTPSMFTFTPTAVQLVSFEGDQWYLLTFEANSVMAPSLRLSVSDRVIFKIYDEFLAKPHMCAYHNYDDALKCMRDVAEYAGATIDADGVATSILVSHIARDPDNPKRLHRYNVAEGIKKEPLYIGFRNVQFGATNLPSAIMGSYSDIGLDSLLVDPPTSLEKFEYFLRL